MGENKITPGLPLENFRPLGKKRRSQKFADRKKLGQKSQNGIVFLNSKTGAMPINFWKKKVFLPETLLPAKLLIIWKGRKKVFLRNARSQKFWGYWKIYFERQIMRTCARACVCVCRRIKEGERKRTLRKRWILWVIGNRRSNTRKRGKKPLIREIEITGNCYLLCIRGKLQTDLIRQFLAEDSAGLFICSFPFLHTEQMCIEKIGGLITSNGDGVRP